MTPRYALARELANELAASQEFSSTSASDVRFFKHTKPIVFVTASQFCSAMGLNYYALIHGDLSDGMTIHDRMRDIYTVVYNDSADGRRILFTLAHEVGHIYMGHDDVDVEAEEIEANVFSTQLLLPDYSIVRIYSEYGTMNPKILCDIFGVSIDAARNRIAQLGKMVRVRVTDNDLRIWAHRENLIGKYFDLRQDYIAMKNATRPIDRAYRSYAITDYDGIWEAASRMII